MIIQVIKEDKIIELSAPGPQGAAGTGGQDASLSIGTVATGDPGTLASALITGQGTDRRLHLTIPQGETGPAGAGGQGVLVLGPSESVPAGTPTNTVIFRYTA